MNPWTVRSLAPDTDTGALPCQGVYTTARQHALTQLYAAPSITSVLADLLLGAINASVHVFNASPVLTLTEQQCVASLCELLGFGTDADGVAMPGGAASNTLALQTALCSACDGAYRDGGVLGLVDALKACGRRGAGARPVLLTSDASHFSCVFSACHVLTQDRPRGAGCWSRHECRRPRADGCVWAHARRPTRCNAF